GDERPGARLDAEACHQGEVAARRAAGDDDAVGVDVQQLGASVAQPAKGVLDVGDDGRQFDLGGQAVIERDQGEALGPAQVEQVVGDVLAAAHDEGAAVNPDDDGADGRVVGAVDVGVDFDL